MLSPSQAIYLDDMRRAASRILEYTDGLDLDGFRGQQIVIDAVLRNFEILGEAASRISSDIRNKSPGIDWQRIKDFRNVVAHVYSGVDLDLTWVLIQQRIPDCCAAWMLCETKSRRREFPEIPAFFAR